MTDMLVRLYDLPPLQPEIDALVGTGITIRRVIGPEKNRVVAWVRENFSDYWASEADVAFGHTPLGCFIAIKDKSLVGFTCYNTTAKGFFGPTGVDESARGQGIGKALLLVGLHALWSEGYAYGIIGRVGPQDFYADIVGAI